MKLFKKASFDERTLLTLVLSLYPVLSKRFTFQCPTREQWFFRASSKCNATLPSYYCLLDMHNDRYKEVCYKYPSRDINGFRKVFAENVDGIECAFDTYQPFTFWTNGSSDCVYKKSLCNGEGQVVHDPGNNVGDQQCRCDYLQGYNFVIKPKNACTCSPSEEDCSCYKMSCPQGQLLTPDYECLSTKEWKMTFGCLELTPSHSITEPAIVLSMDTSQGTWPPLSSYIEPVRKSSKRIGFIVVAVSMVLILFIGTTFSVHMTPRGNTKGSSKHDIPCNIRDLQKTKVDNWKQKLEKFVPTRASAAVMESMIKNQCVVITGSPGCGKTVTAYRVVLDLIKSEEYDLLIVCDPNDILRYSKADGKQIIFIDDIFGKHVVNKKNVDWWENQFKGVQTLMSQNNNLKLLATCRSYVFNVTYSKCLLHFDQISFLSEDICLTIDERRTVGHLYIGNDVRLDDKILMEFDFFPELCSYCSVNPDNVLHELENPRMYVKSEIEILFNHLDIYFILFSLLVMSGNLFKIDVLTNERHKENDKLNELFREVGFKSVSEKQLLLRYFFSLRGSFLLEEKNMYKFKSEKLFNVMTWCISKYIMKSLLKYGKWSVLRDRFTLEQYSKYRGTQQYVSIPQCYEHLYLDRLLLDVKSGLFWDVFLDANNNLSDFRHIFLNHLRTNFTCKDFKEDTKKSTVLHAVADQGYEDYVIFFAGFGKSRVNFEDDHKNTPLHLAAKKGHKSVVEVLINKGAFIDKLNEDGNSPFLIACKEGHVDTVEIFLSKKAAIKQNPVTLQTALRLVCENEHIQLASMLLLQNLKVNVTDQKGFTPLHLACRKGNIELCTLLVSHESNVNYKDNKSRSPIYHACKMNKLDIVELLLKHNASLDIETTEKKKPIHIVCEKGHFEITSKLLNLKVKVDEKDKDGNTPLYLSSMNGHVKIVDLLLIAKADINLWNNGKNLPIHAASSHGHSDVVEYLIEYNTNINCKNKENQTPLHIACKAGHIDIVNLLLKKPKKIETQKTTRQESALNMKDKDSRTPLHIACENGHINIVKLLLDQEADIKCHDKDGSTLTPSTCGEEFVDVEPLLLQHNTRTDVNSTDLKLQTPLFVACKKQNFEMAKILIEKNADVNLSNEDGDTPLHQTAACGDDLLTELLVTHNAIINKKNKLGETPLWKCAINGHKSVSQYLVNKGAETGISNSQGTTLETTIVKTSDKEIVDIVFGTGF